MLKRLAALLLVLVLVSIQSCQSANATSGLKSYIDSTDGYQFMYPTGWLPVQVTGGADVVFHDLIEQTENVSVVISPVPDNKTLAELGTPGEVGYKLSKNAIAPPSSGRKAELVNAESRQEGSKTYYIIEYAVKLPSQKRHDLASVAISRGKLFSFNASTTEARWTKLKPLFEQIVNSFSVY